jgi:small subunit ribosomal protein S3
MGQKTHPFGLAARHHRGPPSRWYAPKALYGELLVEDEKIRKHLDKRLNRAPRTRRVGHPHRAHP